MKGCQKQTRLRMVRVMLAVILAIILLIFGAALLVANTGFLKDKTVGEDGRVADIYQTPDELQDKIQNFLIVCIDNDASLRADQNQTDVILVASCDFENNKVNILQIPRDTYVDDRADAGKINGVYANHPDKWEHSGIDGLIKVVYQAFGINIDHYIALQMDVFQDMVDRIGGVAMDVPVDIKVEDVKVEKGWQRLDGKQALAVVRGRKMYKTADFGRMETQKRFMSAFLDQCRTLSLGEMISLIQLMAGSVRTDLSLHQMTQFYHALKDIGKQDMLVMTVPGYPTSTAQTPYGRRTGRKLDVVSIDKQLAAQLLNQYFTIHLDHEIRPEEMSLIQLHNVKLEEQEWIRSFADLDTDQAQSQARSESFDGESVSSY